MDVWVAALCLIKPTVCESHCIHPPRVHVHQLHFSITHNALMATVAAKGTSSLDGLLVWRRKLYATFMLYIYIYMQHAPSIFKVLIHFFQITLWIFYVHINISGKVGSVHQRYWSSASILVRYSGEKDFQSATKRHDKDNWTRENICRSLTALLQAVRDDAPGSSKKKKNALLTFFMLFDSCHLLLCAS